MTALWERLRARPEILVLLVVLLMTGSTALSAAALWRVSGQTQAIQEGRRTATAVNCAVASAVISAGRKTITSAQPLPPRLERNLERFGYPTFEQRQAGARKAAAAYAQEILVAVANEVGRKSTELVHADGTLNCDAFQSVARTDSP